ncbi:MAG: aminoacyl-tRNA hydrolase [Clostridia bacterium]|nr:aminoacyl-tRNA hydrolase [Clostridia bacterium]
MYLIVGLGNPEKRYEKTFHNVGFISVGDLVEKLGVKFKKTECEASVAEAYIQGEKVIIARPLTYMNNSGRAVKQLVAKYKIPEQNLLVVYDDYDLPKGKIRIRASGSAGTHNGMRSIVGTTGFTNFPRIRIGSKDEEVDIPIIDYVLSEIRKADYTLFAESCGKAADAALSFASGNSIDIVMNKFNG